MTVDHLPASGVELDESAERTEAVDVGDEAENADHGTEVPESAPETTDADATDKSWPQTGFGSFP